jgi:4-amino-4-deoxy-L-arabinose transferase-like glycosyltransferase
MLASLFNPKNKKYSNLLTIGCLLFLLLIVFFAFFYGMASYPILDMNEGLYAEIAREMLASGNYIIPHLNHAPYLEKPPMLYWLIVLSYKTFGVSTFAARLIPALSSTLTCLALIFLSKKIGRPKSGFMAALILASGVGFVIIGRVVFFDMLLTASLTFSLCFFFIWYKNENSFYLRLAYVFLGLAFLTKGLLPVAIAGGTAILFLWLTKTPKTKFLKFFSPTGIILFLLIIIPWLILATIKLPGFAWDYFINEQVYRFLDKRIPADYHTGPIYYYIPRIFAYLFPWSLFIPTLFGRIRNKIHQQDSLKLFLWLWFLVPFIFFSLAGDKGDYYMVLGMPPLAMLIGIKIESYIATQKDAVFEVIFSLITILLLGATIYLLLTETMSAQMANPLMILLASLLAYTIIGSILICKYRKPLLSFFLMTICIIPLIIFFINFKSKTQDEYSQITIANYIQTHDSKRPIYLFRNYERISSILFLLQKPIPIIDSVSKDLYFGSHTDQAKDWFITKDDFLKIANKQNCYVVLLKKKADEFHSKINPPDFHVVSQSGKTLLMSNQK